MLCICTESDCSPSQKSSSTLPASAPPLQSGPIGTHVRPLLPVLCLSHGTPCVQSCHCHFLAEILRRQQQHSIALMCLCCAGNVAFADPESATDAVLSQGTLMPPEEAPDNIGTHLQGPRAWLGWSHCLEASDDMHECNATCPPMHVINGLTRLLPGGWVRAWPKLEAQRHTYAVLHICECTSQVQSVWSALQAMAAVRF